MHFSAIGGVLGPIALVIAVGFVWARRGRAIDAPSATALVGDLGLPCLVFASLTNPSLVLPELGEAVIAALACTSLFALAGIGLLRLSDLPVRPYLAGLVFPNSGNLGLPVVLFAYGQEGLSLAISWLLIGMIGQGTVGLWLQSGKPLGVQALSSPSIFALVAGVIVLLTGWRPPDFVADGVTLIGQVTIPVMLLVLGSALARLGRASLRDGSRLAVFRIGLGASVGWLVAFGLQLEGAVRGVTVLQAAMPASVLTYLFAVRYDSQAEEVAGLIAVSTALSALTIPALLAALAI